MGLVFATIPGRLGDSDLREYMLGWDGMWCHGGGNARAQHALMRERGNCSYLLLFLLALFSNRHFYQCHVASSDPGLSHTTVF